MEIQTIHFRQNNPTYPHTHVLFKLEYDTPYKVGTVFKTGFVATVDGVYVPCYVEYQPDHETGELYAEKYYIAFTPEMKNALERVGEPYFASITRTNGTITTYWYACD